MWEEGFICILKIDPREGGGRWVAKEGDGWLRREMGGYEGIWVARVGEWVAKEGDGWLRWEMGG